MENELYPNFTSYRIAKTDTGKNVLIDLMHPLHSPNSPRGRCMYPSLTNCGRRLWQFLPAAGIIDV